MKDPYQSNWRERLLGRVRYVLIVALGAVAVAVLLGARTAGLRWFGGLLLLVILVLAMVLARPRMPFAWRAWLMIGLVALMSALAYPLVGFVAGPPLGMAFSLVLAALLLGRRSVMGLLALALLVPLCLSIAVAAGVWDGPPGREIAVGDPVVWFRTTLVSVVLWGGIAFSVLFVVQTVERNLERRGEALAEKEAALERLRAEEAQRREAERARRKAEQVAFQAQKQEALGQLAAGVAHDFNNALLVVRGWNDILRSSESPEDRAAGTTAIDQATDQARRLAKQLLTFARKDVRKPRYLEVDRLLEETAKTLGTLLVAGISLEVRAESEAAVFADDTQLQQLLFNLVINARDALPREGKIRVRSRRLEPSELPATLPEGCPGWVAIEVEDDGPGMDEEIRRRAFEPFFTTKDMGSGTGLGLSTVSGIVEQSEGHVDLESEAGQGTKVTVFLPAVELAPAGPEAPARASANGDRDARVLVVEDDPLARQLIVVALTRAGFSVLEANDGDEALDLLRQEAATIDVLCTDAVFPGAPLAEVIETFQELRPAGRVLICSGYVPEDLAAHGVESGAFEFLAKPFTGSGLVRKLDAILGVTGERSG